MPLHTQERSKKKENRKKIQVLRSASRYSFPFPTKSNLTGGARIRIREVDMIWRSCLKLETIKNCWSVMKYKLNICYYERFLPNRAIASGTGHMLWKITGSHQKIAWVTSIQNSWSIGARPKSDWSFASCAPSSVRMSYSCTQMYHDIHIVKKENNICLFFLFIKFSSLCFRQS